MGKFGVLFVALLLLGTARCYGASIDIAGLPVVGAQPAPAAPAYVTSMGTPAAVTLPEMDLSRWFSTEAPESGAPADTYDPAFWAEVEAFFAASRTPAGWAEACKKASDAAGADRATKSEIGALACSANPAVPPVQRFAVQVLGARAALALWIRGTPGSSQGAVSGRQGEARLMCSVDVIAREGGAGSAYEQACTKALDTSYLTGDPAATFAALGEAFSLIAAEIAVRDPKTASEPAYYATAGESTP